jgi:hypothetical protein
MGGSVDKSIAAVLANAGVKPAKPSDAFGDPDRRRGMVSFLTWAFFLSEAFKGIEAEAAGLKATDAPDAASSAAASADGPAQDLPSDAASYNEWPISLPPDAIGKFPVAGHLPAIPEVSMGQPEEFNLARARFSEPPAYGGGGGHSGAHGGGRSTHDGAPADAGPLVQAQIGNPLVDASLHLGPGEGLSVSVSLGSVGDTLQGVLGSPVLSLDNAVGDAVLPVVSDLTTFVSSTVNSLTSGLLGGPVGSSGLINILGGSSGQDSGTELFSGGKYTDYHLALQSGDTTATTMISHDTVGVGLDVGDLIPALGHVNAGAGNDAGAPHIGLPSAVDELLLRGHFDIVL